MNASVRVVFFGSFKLFECRLFCFCVAFFHFSHFGVTSAVDHFFCIFLFYFICAFINLTIPALKQYTCILLVYKERKKKRKISKTHCSLCFLLSFFRYHSRFFYEFSIKMSSICSYSILNFFYGHNFFPSINRHLTIVRLLPFSKIFMFYLEHKAWKKWNCKVQLPKR